MRELGRVDEASDEPVFRQIAQDLREAIRSGRVAPGDQVPSESQLMERFGVARMTVRQALAELRSEGLLVAEQGRGVFVRKRPVVMRIASDRFARRHREGAQAAPPAEVDAFGTASVDEVEVRVEAASSDVRQHLALPARAKVVVRRRRHLLDGAPVELAETYVPKSLAVGTGIGEGDTGDGGIHARLEELGHKLAEFSEEVAARMPTHEESRRLRLPPGTPVLTVRQIAYDIAAAPVALTVMVKAAPSYILEYRFPAV